MNESRIDVSEIDLDRLTTLELWELHYRVAARLSDWDPNQADHQSCDQYGRFDSYPARARMRSLV